MTTERLDSFDKSEWWDVYRIFFPEHTEEQFDKAWDEFQAEKAARASRLGVQ